MIGKLQFQIKSDDFMKGMGTSDYSNDAGFSALSYGITPQVTPGVLYGTPPITDKSTNLAGNLIASCEGGSSNYRVYVDDAAKFYFADSSGALTLSWTGAKTYQKFVTDAVKFNGLYYMSSTTDVAQTNDSGTHTEGWFSALGGGTPGPLASANPHPLIVYNKFLWVADGNLLHTVTESGTVTGSALVLSVNEVVTSLGLDPQSGQMLIGVELLPSITGIQNSSKFIYTFDGASNKPSRKIPVNDLPTGFYSVNGLTYVACPQRVGYWNGNGIQFLRAMPNIALNQSPSQILTKHNMTNIGSTLYVTNGTYVVAYGELQAGGKKMWWNSQKMSGTITLLTSLDAKSLSIGSATNTHSVYDTTATGSQGTLLTNRYEFERPIFIRRVRVFTTGVTTTAGTGQVTVYNDEVGNATLTTVSSFVVPAAQSPKWVFDFDFTSKKLQMAQFSFIFPTSQTVGFNRAVVYYDIAE